MTRLEQIERENQKLFEENLTLAAQVVAMREALAVFKISYHGLQVPTITTIRATVLPAIHVETTATERFVKAAIELAEFEKNFCVNNNCYGTNEPPLVKEYLAAKEALKGANHNRE